MKAFDLIRCGAVTTLSILACLILSTPVWADIFPAELLTEQAAFTNLIDAKVAISGDYLAAGLYTNVSIFHRENGAWRLQGTVTAPSTLESFGENFGSAIAFDGTNLVVGGGGGYNYTYDHAEPVYVFESADQLALNAWSLVDHTTSQGLGFSYDRALTASERQLAASNGWTLTIRCRMVDSFADGNGTSVSPSCLVDYAINPTNRFLIFFNLDTNEDLTAQLSGFPTPITLTTNGDGWAAYHTHQIVFDPTNDTADYLFDGKKMNSSPWSPTAVTPLDGVRFGSGSSAGMGSMNFNKVELKTHVTDQVLASYDAGTAGNPAQAPDPETQGWTLLNTNTDANISKGPVSPDFNSAWTLQAVLKPSRSLQSLFGDSLAIEGDTIIVGSPGVNSDFDYESAYVFVRNGSNWVQQAVLPNPPTSYDYSGQYFATSVALDGDTLVVGAPGGYYSDVPGSAYVFTRSGTNWIQQQQVTNTSPLINSYFGNAVAIDGDRLAIGSPNANSGAGAVYLFGRTNGDWSPQDFLLPTNEPAGQGFGGALALKGNVIVAGGSGYTNSYIFALGDDGWVQATNFGYAHNLGYPANASVYSVAFDGQNVVVSEAAQYETGIAGAVHIYSPDYSNPSAVANYVRKFLYYPNAEGSLLFDPNQAAFRYKTLLYTEGTNGVFAQYTNMVNLYGQPERDRADFAESELAKGLAFHPDDPGLGNLLLDIYYDRSEAETILGKNLLKQAEAAHFPTAISGLPTPSSGFVIDNEIPLYEQAFETNRYALQSYFSLFTNDLGVAGSPPLGYQIFTNLVPGRGLMPATYLDTNGVEESVVSNSAALFDGYKDVTLLFNELQSYGEAAVTLGKLLLARQGPGDGLEASNVVGSAQRLLFLNGALLKSMFVTLPDTNDPSGLAQSIDGWSAGLTALTTLQQNLTGGANLLGFVPDFLMYVYSLPGQPAGIFNSYDALYTYLNPGDMNNSSHPLSLATSALQAAEDSYAAYRGYQDQFADQMTALNQKYADRLRDIVGAYPGDPTYGDNPTNNPGSLLDQQYSIIQQAKLKITRNQTEISNLKQQVEIEINRASSVSNVIIHYGNKNAKITEEIGHIAAAQAFVNGIAGTVGTIGQLEETAAVGATGVGIAGGLNAIFQGAAEEKKGRLEAEKERNSAMEQATITGVNSAAAVKTMLLNMNTLLIESQEAALQLQQAVNQLVGLYREKEQLEQKIAQQNATLASRYYADPVHRLLAQSDMVTADLSFNNAQRWLYFMERALAYKWNTPLDHEFPPNSGMVWTENTLFKLRNADELNEMFDAMNDWDASLQATLAATQTNVDYFSVRNDFFGYAPSNSLGETLTYADPITGRSVDAIQAFRDRLRQLQNTDDPNNSYIDLHFSTVRQIPGKSFFQGPVFTSDGTVVSRGLCLDKIQWIKINLPGTVGSSYIQGTLTYGGTSFIRNLIVGTYDPAQPDHLMNEMTAYSTRRWYFSPAQDVFTSEEAQSTSASMQLSTQAGVVPSSTEIDVFNERSVATSGWELTVPTTVSGVPVLNIDQLNDIEIWFKHIATDRITQ